jgi:hypothetical protein
MKIKLLLVALLIFMSPPAFASYFLYWRDMDGVHHIGGYSQDACEEAKLSVAGHCVPGPDEPTAKQKLADCIFEAKPDPVKIAKCKRDIFVPRQLPNHYGPPYDDD